jgi:hypothetical protein
MNPVGSLGYGFNPGFGGGAGFFLPAGRDYLLGGDIDFLTYSSTQTQSYPGFSGTPPNVTVNTRTFSVSTNEDVFELALDGHFLLVQPKNYSAYVLAGVGAAVQDFSGIGSTWVASPMVRFGGGASLGNSNHLNGFLEIRFNLVFLDESTGRNQPIPAGMILEVPLSAGVEFF